MPEPIQNIRVLCNDCAPKPDPTLISFPPSTFIGKHVKKCFTTESGEREHLWVKITRVDKKGNLIGKIANVPVFMFGFGLHDRAVVTREEIEEVYPRPIQPSTFNPVDL